MKANKSLISSNKTHGMSGTKEYAIWNGIIQRCYNPKHKDFHLYGGRGIRVCDRWRKFENFFADMGLCPPHKKSCGRKNSNGNYEPTNCRWEDDFEQANNKKNNRFLELNGERLTIAQWSHIKKWARSVIYGRKKRGWSDERTLLTPLMPPGDRKSKSYRSMMRSALL